MKPGLVRAAGEISAVGVGGFPARISCRAQAVKLAIIDAAFEASAVPG
jgi:hypothetical protein